MTPHQAKSFLSLCELTPTRATRYLDEHALDGLDTSRVYLGSSFCPRILLQWKPADVTRLCTRFERITLTLPICAESLLDDGLSHAEELIDAARGAIDEITVNDLGMFMYWGERIVDGLDARLNLGRLLSKDTRDARSPDHFGMIQRPGLFARDWQGLANIDRLLATYPIACVEIDPTSTMLDLSDAPNVEVAVLGPLCYQTCGQICEFASIGVPETHKFRPNAPCALQCQKTTVRYRGASDVEYFKIGRAVYFANPDVEVHGATRMRRIISPLLEVMY